eukprot:gene456-23041_t
MVVGSFPALFGTAQGATMQDWCARNGWVLSWSLCVYYKGVQGAAYCPDAERMMDASVVTPPLLAARNLSAAAAADARRAFDGLWAAVAAAVGGRHDPWAPGQAQYRRERQTECFGGTARPEIMPGYHHDTRAAPGHLAHRHKAWWAAWKAGSPEMALRQQRVGDCADIDRC